MQSRYSKQEKFDIIMQCRNSGLSDYQWCKLNGISTSTFYGWTQQLKTSGKEFPEPADRNSFIPSEKQDIVKLEVVDNISLPTDPNTNSDAYTCVSPSVEIEIGQAKIKISNDVSPALLSQIISCVGGRL